jgi:hypothetical protein
MIGFKSSKLNVKWRETLHWETLNGGSIMHTYTDIYTDNYKRQHVLERTASLISTLQREEHGFIGATNKSNTN